MKKGKASLYHHFGGTQTILQYLNLQVNSSVGGGRNCANCFHLEAVPSARPFSCIPGEARLQVTSFPSKSCTRDCDSWMNLPVT